MPYDECSVDSLSEGMYAEIEAASKSVTDIVIRGFIEVHNYIKKKKSVYVSFDIETAGELCGIVKLPNVCKIWCFQGSVSHYKSKLPFI